jgi:hypothetical protein
LEVRTHEEVVGIRVWSTNSEELHQVVKLAMDISTYCHRAFLVFLSDSAHQALVGLILTTGCTFDSSCRTSRA